MAAGNGEVALQPSRTLCERVTKHDDPVRRVWSANFHASALLYLSRLVEVEPAAKSELQYSTAHGIDESFAA